GKLLDRVYNTYLLMHTHQTVEFVRRKSAQYGSCSLRRMSVMEALELLDQLVDESDPDVDFPNSFHAFQTAEGIRRAHPDKGRAGARPCPRRPPPRSPAPRVTRRRSPPDWFHLVGLLHDLGKVLVLFGEPQWAVVGDTFPVGCKVQKLRGSLPVGAQPLPTPPSLSEYMYQVMKFNNFALPKEVSSAWGGPPGGLGVRGERPQSASPPPQAFYMIRFHSFYPWHAHGDYGHLCSEEDRRMLPWLRELNKFDLYTKQEELPDVQQLRAYYQGLIDKYCPGQLCW
ncbi:MIOX oxygenase, partial [Nicator chloris]|nr:MIOX oxygenase [Nicator chloris]